MAALPYCTAYSTMDFAMSIYKETPLQRSWLILQFCTSKPSLTIGLHMPWMILTTENNFVLESCSKRALCLCRHWAGGINVRFCNDFGWLHGLCSTCDSEMIDVMEDREVWPLNLELLSS